MPFPWNQYSSISWKVSISSYRMPVACAIPRTSSSSPGAHLSMDTSKSVEATNAVLQPSIQAWAPSGSSASPSPKSENICCRHTPKSSSISLASSLPWVWPRSKGVPESSM